jgi:S1/P1 Nuclease
MNPTRFCLALACLCLASLLVLMARPAAAWSPEGNMIVALVADRLLQVHDPAVRKRVAAILATDKDNELTGTDIAAEATWAGVVLEKSPEGRAATAQWHYLKLDPGSPDFAKACHGHPDLPAMTPAAHGPQKACIIDKINQFARDLSNPGTRPDERLRGLQFVLALTADLHQPLDVINRGDDAGNCTAILLPGARAPVRLAAYWNDTLVAEAEGRDPAAAADRIVEGLVPGEIARWSDGTLETWARESYDLAKTVAYNFPADVSSGKHPAIGRKSEGGACAAVRVYRVNADYRQRALAVVRTQLAKAGVRLAFLLRLNLR